MFSVSIIYKKNSMKRSILFMFVTGIFATATAQSPVDTFRLFKKPVPSALSQRTDTSKGFQQQPISSQPFPNSPVPPPLTNPIDNPTSGQTNPPVYDPPADIPAARPLQDTAAKPKPLIPVRPVPKPSAYDTVPGTKRNG
jgi:hypothetical protein